MNFLDKMISSISPTWGLQRQRARLVAQSMDSSFAGASISSRKLRGWLPIRGSADRDYSLAEQGTLTARCRDAHRNQPLARAAIERLKHGVVGTGLRLQAKPDWEFLKISDTDGAVLEQEIEREFEHWSRHCDFEKSLTFQQIQSLALVSMLVSGDVFINSPFQESRECVFGLRLQVIEADLVSNPNFVADTRYLRRGIELAPSGAPVAYHIQNQHPGDIYPIEFHWDRFEIFGKETGRRRLFHIFDKERPGQTRGIPFLAPILEPLQQLDKYSDAELTAAVVASLLTVFVKSEGGLGLPPSTKSTTAPENDDEIALSPGAVVNLMPGESIESLDPKRPNTSFEPFVLAIFKQIGAALSLPAEFLLLSFMSSYSAARAALLQAWKLIAYQRKLVETMLCQPIYELWFDELVARERISAAGYWDDPLLRSAWTRATWVGPARGAIDENKEVIAARERVAMGISTLQHEAEELSGMDWMDVQKQRAQEHARRAAAGLEEPVLGMTAAPLDMVKSSELEEETIQIGEENAIRQ